MLKKDRIDSVGKAFQKFLWILLVIYCITLLIPFVWMLLASFKTYDDYLLNIFGWPKNWEISNYAEVMEVFKVTLKSKEGTRITYGVWGMAYYSLLWTFGNSFIHVLLASMCAYVIASFKFRGRNFLFNFGVFIMILPIIGSTPALMILRKQFYIYNSMTLLLLTSESTAFSGLHFMLLYAAFKGISPTYREAVYIDGGNNYTAFFKVIVPLIIPSMVVVFVLQFLSIWSDYNTFIMWMPSYPSISYGMWLFQEVASRQGVSMPVIMATFVVVIIPTVILYLSTQRVLMSKFVVGGLKG